MEIEEIYKAFNESEGVSTDTRTIKKNQMFFALKGENFDGNKHIADALEKGAAYAISDNPHIAKGNEQIILVDSVLHTLQELANFHRNTVDAAIIGITGTNGKTTTKELLYTSLSEKFNVLKTLGNLNNHIGVPLSLLRIKEETEFAIIEMGANKQGDIKELCHIAEPDFGIITNIGRAHLEGFGSVEGIAKTKGELYDFLYETNGIAFINAKDSVLMQRAPTGLEMVLYNRHEYDFANNKIGLLKIKKSSIKADQWIETKLFGNYNLQNLIVSIDVAGYFGVEQEKIHKAIERYTPNLMRSQITEINGANFYIDAYNANPSSMVLGISNFVSLEGSKIMILGDMKELGPEERKFHEEILASIPKDFDGEIYLIGEIFASIPSTYITHYNSVSEFLESFDLESFKGQKIFLKGSRSIKLESIVSAFEEL